ncbi:hypothetical protein Daus18300_011227 [Diaporthe australafricana]|uniref:Uncharacterized protein n=1 Tax=Diaporthe australafricana TaxID=127596 RepID=A0ABR3W7K4_9PEZI
MDNTSNIPMRDLELGDPYRERERERNCERSLGDTDENDIFGNPWNNNPWRVSEDSLEAPKPVSRSLSPGRWLTDPDMVDIPLDDWPLQAPPPVQPRSNPASVLLGLSGRLLRWKTQAAGRKGKGKEPEMARELPIFPEAIPDLASVAQPAAASTAARSDVPYPLWLVGRKASDGPRNARFEELDVDHPTVTPPDEDFLAMQLDLISRAPISAGDPSPSDFTSVKAE